MMPDNDGAIISSDTNTRNDRGIQQEILLREFDVRHSEARLRLESNDRILNLILVISAASIAAVDPLIKTMGARIWTLSLAMVFVIAGLVGNRVFNEILMVTNASYVEQVLRPSLAELSGHTIDPSWEIYLRKGVFRPTQRLIWSLTPMLYILPLICIPGLFVFYGHTSAQWYDWSIFTGDIVMFLWIAYALFHRSYCLATVPTHKPEITPINEMIKPVNETHHRLSNTAESIKVQSSDKDHVNRRSHNNVTGNK